MIGLLFSADGALSLPVQGGLLGAVLAICGIFLRFMAQARRDGYDLAEERAEDATAQRNRNTVEIDRILDRMTALEDEVREQRSLKHASLNQLTRAELLLETIRPLAQKCTCGSLDAVNAILDRRYE